MANRIRHALAAGAVTTLLAACGSGEPARDTASPSRSANVDLSAVKAYLLSHTERLVSDTAAIRATAERYDALAERHGYDYAALLREDRAEARGLVRALQRGFTNANPAYEEMEGVVAGVPALADYDVDIDAGSDASDPENAVSF